MVGFVLLPVTIGTYPTSATTLIDFLVVNKRYSYNAIIEFTTLDALHVVSAIYYLTLKFPTPMRWRVVKGDQETAWGCYCSPLKGLLGQESCQVVEKWRKTVDDIPTDLPSNDVDLELDNQDQKRVAWPQVDESLDKIEVATGKTVRISVALTGTLRDSLVKFLV